MKNEIDINWEILGAKFANLGDNKQALFFRGMARELSHWDSIHNKQMQFFSVARKLTEKDKIELQKSLECLWWEEGNDS